MPEDQFASGHWGRAPIILNHFPSGLPRYSSFPPSPHQPGEAEPGAPNETDTQLEHCPPLSGLRWSNKVEYGFQEVENEDLGSSIPDNQGGELASSTLDSVPNERLEATNQTCDYTIPANPIEKGMNETVDPYIPVGVLGRSPSVTHLPASEIALLEKHSWIRTRPLDHSDNVQIFVLPNAERSLGSGSASRNISALKLVMSKIDSSSEAWNGGQPVNPPTNDEEDESLWYIFNTLQNPDPSVNEIKEIHTRMAMEDLLDDSVLGLKTSLHQYQRRSAAMMVQREAQPDLVLDPRFQAWKGPTGLEFYYDKETGSILREKIMYPEACGGILAESMGCGKTLISLAVILATRGQFPKIPVEHQTVSNPIRARTGTLLQMAAASAGRFSLPWKQFFHRLESEGRIYNNCIKACEASSGSYYISPPAKYQSRNSSSHIRAAEQVRLCSGTIVIVPPNLVDHWNNEIATHTMGLKVLVLREKSSKTPSADELLKFDIVLFSKSRFKQEPQSRNKNKPNSPIFNLHWLRVIVDEGHDVAGQGTDLVHRLEALHFERRWIISGTPARRMYGVELNRASHQASTSDTESSSSALTAAVLERRKNTGNATREEFKDVDGLGSMVISFLDLKPWSNNRKLWAQYTKLVGENGVRRKSPSLRVTLQSLIVRHRLDVVREEITLPPMFNKVVYLNPTLHDRLSINIFLFTLAVNAITSERQGPDYMFDPVNSKSLNLLIGNLRQAGFWWVGSGDHVQSTVNIALEYMEKNRAKMSAADIKQLGQGIQIAQQALGSSVWNGFSNLRELGVFVRGFPEHARSLWALNPADTSNEPLLMGISQACKAQEFVKNRLRHSDPAEGLAGYGIKIRRELAKPVHKVAHSGAPESAKPEPDRKPNPKSKKSVKHTFDKKFVRTLPDASPLKETLLEGVTSAKLRYLLEKVLEFQEMEKIIIFFEDDNTAIWVAEGLELLAINFRIYANSQSLNSDLRDKYLNLFRESGDIRVLLMDLKQASHGLHIAQASRIFIINPIWEPNIESQAIGRAHRIGQTRPVHVETLVLEGTIEKAMLHRRKEMSEAEIQQTKSMTDDSTMSDIIRSAPFLPMFDESSTTMASLGRPVGFFDRHTLPIPDQEVVPARDPLQQLLERTRPFSGSDADSDLDAAEAQTRIKRPRLGFAETVQLEGDGHSETVPGQRQSLSRLDPSSASSAWKPASEQPGLSGVERVRLMWSSVPTPDSPQHGSAFASVAHIDSERDGVGRPASLFGP